ncbi:FAD-dependent oxidoreductase [Nocardia sp. NPDC003482]
MSPMDSVIVLGGGIGGLLSAAAVAPHASSVIVVEKDSLSTVPVERRGLPQAQHTHMLMPSGAAATDALVPGSIDQLVGAGAHRIGMNANIVSYSQRGWVQRMPARRHAITCSRPLIDATVLARVQDLPNVSFEIGCQAVGLVGTSQRVSGVRIRDEGGERVARAALVIDATGRGSRTIAWLESLGVPSVPTDCVDSGQAYATRVFRAPAGAETGFPMITIIADPSSTQPGRGAVLTPIENGNWMVTLGGTRGGEPPTDENGYRFFARHAVRHPLVADAIARAEPIGSIRGSRSTTNRRRRFDLSSAWPAGFLVVGDASATFNPVYGHGMSVAAREALAIREILDRVEPDVFSTRGLQRSISRCAVDAWQIAASQDMRYPATKGSPPGRAARLRNLYLDRIIRTACVEPRVRSALIDVYSLSRPLSTFTKPGLALRVMRGPTHSPPIDPPLTEHEREIIGVRERQVAE